MHCTPLDKPTANQLKIMDQICQLKIKISKIHFETKKGKETNTKRPLLHLDTLKKISQTYLPII